MGRLVEALQQAGYRDGETLFGAPYDFRQAPAAPGQPCRAFSRFTRRFRALVERASRVNGGRPVVVVSHSQGGYLALEFLKRSPLPWRRRYVRRYVMASTGAGGFLSVMSQLASTPGVALSAASAFTALPSPVVFGPGTPPLVVTRDRNYTASDMSEFLAAIGVPPLGVTLYETRALPVQLGFRAPVVPTTCINGVGVPTTKQLVYWDGNFSETPQVVYGDGDGLLPLASIVALDTVIGGDTRQEYYKSIKLAGTSHAGVVSDAAALKRIVDEIFWSTPV
jgi:lysophospholipase-3